MGRHDGRRVVEVDQLGHRTTTTPFAQWRWHQRAAERLYRWTHHRQIRTLVYRVEWERWRDHT